MSRLPASRAAEVRQPHREHHRLERIGWLRAAVLGANDGVTSTASLMIGVAASQTARGNVLVAGVSGLVAGAMSMAAGEYVSVSSQADAQRAELAVERAELQHDPAAELQELTGIYERRGLPRELASEVATALSARDPLEAHARDELGLTSTARARPVQAAFASAASFAAGAAVPLAAALVGTGRIQAAAIAVAALLALAVLGAVGARVGGAAGRRGAVRVVTWGALAMLFAAGVGFAVGAVAP